MPSLKINVGSVYRNGQNMYVTKMGVSLMDNPTDDVFEYKSPLFKSQ